jgi:hypothetical protein
MRRNDFMMVGSGKLLAYRLQNLMIAGVPGHDKLGVIDLQAGLG